MLTFELTKRTDPRLLERMSSHYSQPKGFVGRNLCFAINYDGVYYGHIVAGSATRYLPGRNEFLGTNLAQLNNIINNIFYNVPPVNGKYPCRNFTTKVLRTFLSESKRVWEQKYGDIVVGFETLIELPRTGELYKRAGFVHVGNTKGYTCKRVSGSGSDVWGGKRVWNTLDLRPKLVFCLSAEGI